MKKINNYEELKAFCVGIKKRRCQNYVSFIYLKKYNHYHILWSAIQPEFDSGFWRVIDFGNQTQTGNNIELSFNCDFSKCCWGIEQ